jgi:hypothetical protein
MEIDEMSEEADFQLRGREAAEARADKAEAEVEQTNLAWVEDQLRLGNAQDARDAEKARADKLQEEAERLTKERDGLYVRNRQCVECADALFARADSLENALREIEHITECDCTEGTDPNCIAAAALEEKP